MDFSVPWRRLQSARIQDLALPIVLVGLVGVGAWALPGVFLSTDNLLTVLTQASVVGIVAVGMTFVIATGGIDLSVGSLLAVAGIAGGLMADHGAMAFVAVAIATATALGAVNAAAITAGRIVPFVATLAMLTIARGLALRLSGKTPIQLFELEGVRYLGSGRIAGIPVPILLCAAVFVFGWIVLHHSRYGRYVIAVGGNAEAARIAGIRPQRVLFAAYVLIGCLTGVAAVLLSGRLGSASPVVGMLLELDAIAAVIIGGSSLRGGRASMVGTLLGVLTLALMFNLLNLLNMPTELQQIARGIIILAAVALQRRG